MDEGGNGGAERDVQGERHSVTQREREKEGARTGMK